MRLAAPLIPPRLIADVAWYSKKEGEIPSMIKMTNGWELVFYSSLGKPPTGSDIDGWWFDEEIVDESWYPEMIARILDRRGVGIWSATPQAGTDQLFELHEQAERERDLPDANVQEFLCLLAENPHMTDADRRFMASTLNEEELRVRVGGDFALHAFKVYPEFSGHYHFVKLEGDTQVPMDWMRVAVVDPGYQVCAVLFAALPPPNLGDGIYLYDELYIKNCAAAQFARSMSEKCKGYQFQEFLIDPKGSSLSDIGSGKTVGMQYSEELAKVGVKSIETGPSFRLAVDSLDAGLLRCVVCWPSARVACHVCGVVEGRCPNLIEEFKRTPQAQLRRPVRTEPVQKNNHLMDCLRYLALRSALCQAGGHESLLARWCEPSGPSRRRSGRRWQGRCHTSGLDRGQVHNVPTPWTIRGGLGGATVAAPGRSLGATERWVFGLLARSTIPGKPFTTPAAHRQAVRRRLRLGGRSGCRSWPSGRRRGSGSLGRRCPMAGLLTMGCRPAWELSGRPEFEAAKPSAWWKRWAATGGELLAERGGRGTSPRTP